MAHHFQLNYAGVAELADALDLGSSAARRGGSTPFTRICGSSSVVEHHLAKVGTPWSQTKCSTKLSYFPYVVNNHNKMARPIGVEPITS